MNEETATKAVRKPVAVLEPHRGWAPLQLGELWRHRELIGVLSGRDIRVRYKQTILGILWALIQPAVQLGLFTVIFGNLAKIPSDGMPYPIFAYAAILPWSYFSSAFARTTSSMVSASHLITKVYFPRLVVPMAATLTPLVDFGIALLILIGLMVHYSIEPSWALLGLPAFFLLAWTTAVGAGLWLGSLYVHFRDVGHTLPFISQGWMFATPIIYPASILPDWARPYLGLNPMAGVVEGFRWALFQHSAAPGPEILLSAVVALTLLVSGLFFFKRMERNFVDVI